MTRKQHEKTSAPDSPEEPSPGKQHRSPSPPEGTSTTGSGYPEKRGPRTDAQGWGESHATRGDDASEAESQGHAAGKRSFDQGPDDQAAGQDANDSNLNEPGERGAADARSPANEKTQPGSPDDGAPDPSPKPMSFEGSQRDYGQGGGQGYVHSGKPGAPDPKGK